MKIRVEKEKIVRAMRKLASIEIVLENDADAKEAIETIVMRSDLLASARGAKPKDINVKSIQEYSDSAVAYKVMYLVEFVFDEAAPLDDRILLIKKFQDFFGTL